MVDVKAYLSLSRAAVLRHVYPVLMFSMCGMKWGGSVSMLLNTQVALFNLLTCVHTEEI